MKKFKLIFLVFFFISFVVTCIYGSGSLTSTHQKNMIIKKLTLDWTSSTTGAVSQTTPYICGELDRVCFAPEGTTVNSKYSVYLYTSATDDNYAYDLLYNTGYNLVGTNYTSVVPLVDDADGSKSQKVTFCGTYTLAVSNAGNAQSGKVIFWYK